MPHNKRLEPDAALRRRSAATLESMMNDDKKAISRWGYCKRVNQRKGPAMKLVFVNIMHELYQLDSTATISQPPVPLDVLEREIDQLQDLYPKAFLQFTDDNLLADRDYGAEVLALLRRKKRRFVTMVTLDQFCDSALMQEMASSGCLGVAVGVESVDDDNCLSVGKRHNVSQPFPEAVCQANEKGIQVCALLMVGLPHDTPERLARTQRYLEKVPCSLYDLRILRIYPGSRLYDRMLSRGNVTDAWWLGNEPVSTNHFLPGHLRVHLKHSHFSPMQLQYSTLTLTRELDRMNRKAVAHVLRVGRRGGALKFAAMILSARSLTVKQARTLLDRVEQAMEAHDGECS